jgi:hypothetical protein
MDFRRDSAVAIGKRAPAVKTKSDQIALVARFTLRHPT